LLERSFGPSVVLAITAGRVPPLAASRHRRLARVAARAFAATPRSNAAAFLIPNSQFPISNFKFQMPNFKCQMPNAKCQMSDVICRRHPRRKQGIWAKRGRRDCNQPDTKPPAGRQAQRSAGTVSKGTRVPEGRLTLAANSQIPDFKFAMCRSALARWRALAPVREHRSADSYWMREARRSWKREPLDSV
jgi:hypothetical protein